MTIYQNRSPPVSSCSRLLSWAIVARGGQPQTVDATLPQPGSAPVRGCGLSVRTFRHRGVDSRFGACACSCRLLSRLLFLHRELGRFAPADAEGWADTPRCYDLGCFVCHLPGNCRRLYFFVALPEASRATVRRLVGQPGNFILWLPKLFGELYEFHDSFRSGLSPPGRDSTMEETLGVELGFGDRGTRLFAKSREIGSPRVRAHAGHFLLLEQLADPISITVWSWSTRAPFLFCGNYLESGASWRNRKNRRRSLAPLGYRVEIVHPVPDLWSRLGQF